MKITVLSGKGGVGKSSIASSLAVLFSREKSVIAVDCDVDAPNLGLCLGLKEEDFEKEEISTTEVARVIKPKFEGYEKCKDVCEFSAITIDEKGLNINPFLCEGCGACELFCSKGAIKTEKVVNGWIGSAKKDFPVFSGQLKTGQSGSGEIINLLKEKASKTEHQIMIIDASAGIGCPVISSIKGSDFVVAVTEPTPSALSDLKRALEVVKHFRIKYGVIINKVDINPDFVKTIEDMLETEKIPILGKIPYDIDFVNAIVNLMPPVVYNKKFEPLFESIIKNIETASK